MLLLPELRRRLKRLEARAAPVRRQHGVNGGGGRRRGQERSPARLLLKSRWLEGNGGAVGVIKRRRIRRLMERRVSRSPSEREKGRAETALLARCFGVENGGGGGPVECGATNAAALCRRRRCFSVTPG